MRKAGDKMYEDRRARLRTAGDTMFSPLDICKGKSGKLCMLYDINDNGTFRIREIKGVVTYVFEYNLATKEMSPRKEVSKGFPDEGYILRQLPAIKVSWFFDSEGEINWEDVVGTIKCLEKDLDKEPMSIPVRVKVR